MLSFLFLAPLHFFIQNIFFESFGTHSTNFFSCWGFIQNWRHTYLNILTFAPLIIFFSCKVYELSSQNLWHPSLSAWRHLKKTPNEKAYFIGLTPEWHMVLECNKSFFITGRREKTKSANWIITWRVICPVIRSF